MKLSRERIAEFKELLEENSEKVVSWEEATDGAYRLVGYAELVLELAEKEQLMPPILSCSVASPWSMEVAVMDDEVIISIL